MFGGAHTTGQVGLVDAWQAVLGVRFNGRNTYKRTVQHIQETKQRACRAVVARCGHQYQPVRMCQRLLQNSQLVAPETGVL
jgi:hypothetical protein